MAYVNGKITAAQRGSGMAIYNAVGIGLPTFIASIIGGYLVEKWGFNALFLSYAALPLVGVLILVFLGKTLLRRNEPGTVDARSQAVGEAALDRRGEAGRGR